MIRTFEVIAFRHECKSISASHQPLIQLVVCFSPIRTDYLRTLKAETASMIIYAP